MRLLLAGNPGIEHVGSHFREAAAELAIDTVFVDYRAAYNGPSLKRKFDWWLRGRRPASLSKMSMHVERVCRERRCDLLLTTGIAPLDAPALRRIGERGVKRVNFLTDDPWNPAHRPPWFFDALPHYDCVFSPRRANLDQLSAAGCRRVEYLPFAYAPHVHFRGNIDEAERRSLECDVIFAGGADADRAPWIAALAKGGFSVGLYGGYWDRFPATRNLSRGMAGMENIRKGMAAAKIALCLVRRQNRDGHAMRSFEVPAFGACPLMERTAEHEELFGTGDRAAAAYFETIPQMVDRVR
jgi:hypothetical protein